MPNGELLHFFACNISLRIVFNCKRLAVDIKMRALPQSSTPAAWQQPITTIPMISPQRTDRPKGASSVQQHHSLETVHGAGIASNVRLRRQPLALAILAASLAVPGGIVWAEEANGQGTLELGATAITDTALGETTEGTHSYTTGATRTATRMALSPRETPQSVSVITRQQMEDQNLTSISDVLAKTPGVTVTKLDSNRASFQVIACILCGMDATSTDDGHILNAIGEDAD